MNALAGGGTFATLPALIALGAARQYRQCDLATSRCCRARWPAPGPIAMSSSRSAGMPVRALAGITFAGGLVGSLLLVLTPTRAFDLIIPWLLLFALVVMLFGNERIRLAARRA